MPDLQLQVANLSKRIAELEAELGAACGDTIEIVTEMAPFLERFRTEVMRYHRALALAQRELADVRAYRGDVHALEKGQPESPLDELLKRDSLTVQEQFDRVWGREDKDPPQSMGSSNHKPASREVKALYAKAVAYLHPELAQNTEERKEHLKLFNQVGTAYLNRDQGTLQSVVDAFTPHTNLPAVIDPQNMQKLKDRIYQLETVTQNVTGQLYDYRYGDVARVRAHALQAEAEGHDLLADLGEKIQQALRMTLEELKRSRKDLEQQ